MPDIKVHAGADMKAVGAIAVIVRNRIVVVPRAPIIGVMNKALFVLTGVIAPSHWTPPKTLGLRVIDRLRSRWLRGRSSLRGVLQLLPAADVSTYLR